MAINNLNPAQPAGSDFGSTLDDVMRTISTELLATFPFIDGPVAATDTELNYLIGVSASIQSQITNLGNQISTLEGRSRIEQGEVASNGSDVAVPDGWLSSQVATGHYRITHNLGLAVTKYAPMAMPVLSTAVASIPSPLNTNYFDVKFTVSGSLTNTAFTFMLGIAA